MNRIIEEVGRAEEFYEFLSLHIFGQRFSQTELHTDHTHMSCNCAKTMQHTAPTVIIIILYDHLLIA